MYILPFTPSIFAACSFDSVTTQILGELTPLRDGLFRKNPNAMDARYKHATRPATTEYAMMNLLLPLASCNPNPPLTMPRIIRLRPHQMWIWLMMPLFWCMV